MSNYPRTQNDVDELFGYWFDAGYPYMGGPEHNRHVLEDDGRIRSVWKNDDGEFQFDEDDVIETIEEWVESFNAWRFDW